MRIQKISNETYSNRTKDSNLTLPHNAFSNSLIPNNAYQVIQKQVLSQSKTEEQIHQTQLRKGCPQCLYYRQQIQNLQLMVQRLKKQTIVHYSDGNAIMQNQSKSIENKSGTFQSPSLLKQKSNIPTTLLHFHDQISELTEQLNVSKQKLDQKQLIIRELQEKCETKNTEIKKIDSVLHVYRSKIQYLEQQLRKIESLSIGSLENKEIKYQNSILCQKMVSLQRRINVLEESNDSLREELKKLIQSRNKQKNQKTGSVQFNQNILQQVKVLKKELQKIMQSNTVLKEQNLRMQNKIEEMQQTNPEKQNYLIQSDYSPSFRANSSIKVTKLFDEQESSLILNHNQINYESELQKKIDLLKLENKGLKNFMHS